MLDEQKNMLLNELKNSQSNQSEEEQYIIKEREKRFKEYNKLVVIFTIAFLFVLSFALEYFKYVNLISGNSTLGEHKEFIEEFKSKKNQYLGWIGMGDENSITETLEVNFNVSSGNILKDEVLKYINNNDVPYAEKKESIEKFFNSFSEELIKNDSIIEKINTDIGIYGFLSQEIDGIVSDNSIQRSILSVEGIKFYTAMDIFSRLPSFREALSGILSENVDKIKSDLSYFLQRGDEDIQRYLTTCYLNPYEKGWECSEFGDFDQYYETQKAGNNKNEYKNFNTKIFKRTVNYIEQKLEYEEPSKLSIIMNSLDPIKNNIEFSVGINTLKEDENLLFQEGIANPHIQMVSVFLSLLRKSHLIFGSDTKFNDITINEIKESVGTQEISFSNSKFDFNVPVQKSVEREIYDYIYK